MGRLIWNGGYIKKKKVILIIIPLLFLYLASLDGSLEPIGDNAEYILLAKSIALGQGYKNIYEVNNSPHTKYPPLFPLLLAPIVYFSGYNFIAMKLLVMIIGICSLYLIFILFRNILDEFTAFWIMLLSGISYQIVFYSHTVLSEIPYLAISLLALIFTTRYHNAPNGQTKIGLLAATFIFLAYFTRSIGISLWVAALLYLFLIRNQQKGKKLLVTGTLFLIPFLIWNFQKPHVIRHAPISYGNLNYQEQFWLKDLFCPDLGTMGTIDFIKRIYHHAIVYTQEIAGVIFPTSQWDLNKYLAIPIVLLISYGFLDSLLKRKTLLEFYIPLYLSVLLVFTISTPRFIVPIIPFIWYYLIVGLKKSLETFIPYTQYALQIILCLCILPNITATIRNNVLADQQNYTKTIWRDYLEIGTWMKENASLESIIMNRKPAFLFLWSQRKAVRIPFTDDSSVVLRAIGERDIDYIVEDPSSQLTRKYLSPTLQSKPKKFIPVFQKNGYTIYEVKKSKVGTAL
jgi:4-amino-4-deoxy-L-arabinose transferase-like glycosyltransferase